MIWIIGGTSEAAELVQKIKGIRDYIVTVATNNGSEMLNGQNVVVSRMTEGGMEDFIKKNDIDILIDVSHPYAVEVTQNARAASQKMGIRFLRYVRENASLEGAVIFNDLASCMEYLKTIKGCVFFTTGIKNIKDFEKVRESSRFVYRVLPSTYSLQECADNNLNMDDIVAILGPVSQELNEAMFREYKADYVVMKDSGIRGGTLQKIAACLNLGITPIVIGRAEEDGIYSMDRLLEMIL